MENKWTDRTALLLGGDKMQRLAAAHILVVGVGGVGAYAAEMLCRAGVGEMTIIDADTINVTNINRQLPATHSTIGLSKVEVLANRFRDINPEIRLHTLPMYLEDDEWKRVDPATVAINGKLLTFTTDADVPYAIVVNTQATAPAEEADGNDLWVHAVIISTSATAMGIVAFKNRKKLFFFF